MGVGAVPSAPFPWTLLLLNDCVAPLNAVPLKAISLLESRIVTVPPALKRCSLLQLPARLGLRFQPRCFQRTPSG